MWQTDGANINTSIHSTYTLGMQINTWNRIISCAEFTCIVRTARNYHIRELLSLWTMRMLLLVMLLRLKLIQLLLALTGEQNSSNAGLTNVMYWLSTVSKSRPLSLMSRGTATNENTQTTIIYISPSIFSDIYGYINSSAYKLPRRARRVSESVSTNNFIWNKSRMAGK